MGAKWKRRAAKGQAEWGWKTLRKASRCSGVPCVLNPPLVATIVAYRHRGPPPAHGNMPEGTPFRELCSPTSIGCLAFQSSSVMVSLHHQAGDKGPEKAHGPRPPLPFANVETDPEGESHLPIQGHSELVMLREGFFTALGLTRCGARSPCCPLPSSCLSTLPTTLESQLWTSQASAAPAGPLVPRYHTQLSL